MLRKIIGIHCKTLPKSFHNSFTSCTPIHSEFQSCTPIHDFIETSTSTQKKPTILQLCTPIHTIFKPRAPIRALRLHSFFKNPRKQFSEEIKNEKTSEETKQANEKLLKECEEGLKSAIEKKEFANFLNFATTIYEIKKQLYGENYDKGLFEDLRNLGYGHYLESKFTEALFYYDEALKHAVKEQDFVDVYLNLGQLYKGMNNDEAALDALNEGYTHAKTLFSTYIGLGGEALVKTCYQMANISGNLMEIYGRRQNNVRRKVVLSENIQMFTALFKGDLDFSEQNARDFMSHTYECCEELTGMALSEKNFDLAERTIEQEINTVKFSNDVFYLARGLFNQALVKTSSQKLAEARQLFIKAKELLWKFIEEKPEKKYNELYLKEYEMLMYMIFGGLANVHLELNEKDHGLKLIDDVEKFNETHPTEDTFVFLHILNKKAEFLLADQKFEDVLKLLIRINEGLGKMDQNINRNLMFKSHIMSQMTSVMGELEKYEEALTIASNNEPLIKKMIQEFPEKTEALAMHHYTVGALNGRLKKYKESRKAYGNSLEKYKEIGNKWMEIDRIYTDLGFLAEEEGDIVRARQYYANSLEIRKKLTQEVNDPLVDEVKDKINELKPKPKAKPKKK